MKRLLCVILCALFALNTTACFKKQGESVVFSLPLEPISLDPCKADDYSSLSVTMNLFEGLTRVDKAGDVKPGAAESWQISPEGTTATFQIDPLAKWADGSPVTAADFLFALQRTLDPQTKSPHAKDLWFLEGAQEISQGKKGAETLGVTASGNTLTLRMKATYPELLELCATSLFFPCKEEFFTKTAGKYGLEADMILGNGRYYLYKWSHSETLRLRRNEHYPRNKDTRVISVRFRIGEITAEPEEALEKNLASVVKINESQFNELAQKGYETVSFEDTTWGIYANVQDETLKNSNIRKALFGGVDPSFVKVTQASMRPAYALIPPQAVWENVKYRERAAESLIPAFDPEGSKNAMVKGKNEMKITKGPAITLLCEDTKETVALLGDVLQSWQKYLNTFVTLEPLSAAELDKRVRSGRYQLVYTWLRGANHTPEATLSLFETGHVRNIAGLSDAGFEEKLANCHSLEGEALWQALTDCERTLYNKHVFYPLSYETRYYAKAKNSSVQMLPFDEPVVFE